MISKKATFNKFYNSFVAYDEAISNSKNEKWKNSKSGE